MKTRMIFLILVALQFSLAAFAGPGTQQCAIISQADSDDCYKAWAALHMRTYAPVPAGAPQAADGDLAALQQEATDIANAKTKCTNLRDSQDQNDPGCKKSCDKLAGTYPKEKSNIETVETNNCIVPITTTLINLGTDETENVNATAAAQASKTCSATGTGC